uniref:Cysteine-rich RLK (Receptor-like protein kinase) 8 n=1 Tax=Tanacetum cinerariifolium TaxID=118510 RepID=A0A6L2MM68_TANCI|nr:cysteine-rich RLK (receptor-like protein kinase) 8 [Tanacetum cinerariifolium]
MKTESLAGNKYFLLFTDDFSRMSWVYFLRQKSESFKYFRKFKALVEKQSGKALKFLRTDRGGEFTSKDFDAFCDERGIRRQLTASYTPEQNGVAERKNRTVVEMARSMLKQKGMPDSFWAEGVATVVYILNLSPTKVVWNETPYEAWFGNKPSPPGIENLKRTTRSEHGHVPRRRFPIEGEDTSSLVMFAGDPISVNEAMAKEEWRVAMQEDLSAIQRNQTWELVDLPNGKNLITLKWIFKTKFLADGSIQKHKARLVVRGFTQQKGIDYEETFSPVARFETVRIILAVATQEQWKIHQFDVKLTFLNEELKEEVYVTQPPSFESNTKPNKVLRLRKALYGLKQAPRAWYSKIDDFFHKNGFEKSQHEPTLYIKRQGTQDYGIWFSKTEDFRLKGYTDSDWAGSVDDMRSTSGNCFTLGTAVISWSSKKQASVALSSTEAEYVAAAAASCQAVWLRRILKDVGHEQVKLTIIKCDNKSAVLLARNLIYHGRTKHIEIKHHYIRELIANGEVQLEECQSDEQIADVLTKSLPRVKHEELTTQLGVSTLE